MCKVHLTLKIHHGCDHTTILLQLGMFCFGQFPQKRQMPTLHADDSVKTSVLQQCGVITRGISRVSIYDWNKLVSSSSVITHMKSMMVMSLYGYLVAWKCRNWRMHHISPNRRAACEGSDTRCTCSVFTEHLLWWIWYQTNVINVLAIKKVSRHWPI